MTYGPPAKTLLPRDQAESWSVITELGQLIAEPHPDAAGHWLLYAADHAGPGEQVAEWGTEDCHELLSAGVSILDRDGTRFDAFD